MERRKGSRQQGALPREVYAQGRQRQVVCADELHLLGVRKPVQAVEVVQRSFELGDVEKGKTIFEQTIKLYPKRGDVWTVYADLLMKFESIEQAVIVLERGLDEIQKRQPRNHLIKRLVYMEERRGDEERAQESV